MERIFIMVLNEPLSKPLFCPGSGDDIICHKIVCPERNHERVWNFHEDGEEELPETEGSPEEASEREGSFPSKQRSAVDSMRRTDEARRQDEEPFEGEEKRQEPEHRSEEERRGISYDVTCKTSGSIGVIENWLDDNCEGEWKIIIEDTDDDLVNKNFRVIFEYAEERQKFLRLYIKKEE